MIRAEVQPCSWTWLQPSPDRVERLRAFCFGAATRRESVMKHKHEAEAKNDFFYAVVMFAIFAVMVFNVAVEFFEREHKAYFAQVAEAPQPRAVAVKADARAVPAARKE
jgi:hypothetical protein